MELIGKNIAILVDIAYQEMEVWYPFYRFQEAGAECVFVAAEAGKVYLSKIGYPATAQLSYDAASADDFDGVVVPGGEPPGYIPRRPKGHQIVEDRDAQGEPGSPTRPGPRELCATDILRRPRGPRL